MEEGESRRKQRTRTSAILNLDDLLDDLIGEVDGHLLHPGGGLGLGGVELGEGERDLNVHLSLSLGGGSGDLSVDERLLRGEVLGDLGAGAGDDGLLLRLHVQGAKRGGGEGACVLKKSAHDDPWWERQVPVCNDDSLK